MDIDSETITSPPSIVHRETTINPVAPVNIPRDIAVGHTRFSWAQQTMQEEEGHAASQGTSRESKRPNIFSIYFSAMSHIIDYEPYFHGESIGE
jgi:hypothetical protein